MKTSALEYELPERLIAQHPAEQRSESRLMVLRRREQAIEHRRFGELPALLSPGDLLVLNDTRVLPARLMARRSTGGRVEGLFIAETAPGTWEVMLTKTRRLRGGETLHLRGEQYRLQLVEPRGQGHWTARVDPPHDARSVLERCGLTPLPPYIHRATIDEAQDRSDRERYQTVYASRPGAVAAPTAGLHFTPELLEQLARQGIGRALLTLHVGLGTFLPVTTGAVEDHRMHSEWYDLPAETAEAGNETRGQSGRVVAVGTTSARVLETCAGPEERLSPGRGQTDLMIAPPHRVCGFDALITNFHLPRSTLLALVFAVAGRDFVLQAYRAAVEREYRFYSYGDAMLIL